jgi:hypothetical protein
MLEGDYYCPDNATRGGALGDGCFGVAVARRPLARLPAGAVRSGKGTKSVAELMNVVKRFAR